MLQNVLQRIAMLRAACIVILYRRPSFSLSVCLSVKTNEGRMISVSTMCL